MIPFSANAQTGAIRYEEIQVKAPFAMPVIKMPVFPKKNFIITECGAKGPDASLETRSPGDSYP